MATRLPAGVPALGGPIGLARLIALAVPATLLTAAYAFQYVGGLAPCDMCYWQRWAHMGALAFAVGAFLVGRSGGAARGMVLLAALAILASGAIGAYHAGVEAGIFQGATQCASVAAAGTPQDALAHILSTPLVRCDQVQWQFMAISMAGWNAILSIGSVAVILWLSLKRNFARS